MRPVLIRPSTPGDLAAVTAVYGWHVRHGTGTFEIDPPDMAEMARRREDVVAKALPDHGFTVLHVTDERLQMDWHAISDRRDPRATTHVIASWAVAAGSARVRPVRDPVSA